MINQKDAYQSEYDVLNYWGINPHKAGGSSCGYYLKLFIVLAMAFTLITPIMIFTAIEKHPDKVIGAFYFSATELTFIFKLLNYLYKRNDIVQIDELYSAEIFNSFNRQEAQFIADSVRGVRLLGRLFKILIVLCLIMYTVTPIIDDRLLPLDAWFPFSIENYRYFLILQQVSGVGISSLINSSMDIVTCGFISLASAHFSIIKQRLINIKVGQDPQAVKRIIAHCCYYHNNILDVTTRIENGFTYGILLQFIASVVVLCVTGFEMFIVSQQSAEFLMLIIYLLLIMCQISLYCWFGHNLMLKSMEIRDACYLSEWTDYDPSVRKMLFIIMERSKRPVILTGGKLFALNIPTLVNIFRSSYSYYAILRQVFTKDEQLF